MYEHFDDFKLDTLNCGTDYYADASLISYKDNVKRYADRAMVSTLLRT